MGRNKTATLLEDNVKLSRDPQLVCGKHAFELHFELAFKLISSRQR